MQILKDQVAVITGAASGIGLALATRAAQEGMKVVLADIEADALAKAEAKFKAEGATVLAVLTDVSKAEDIQGLAQKSLDAFGAVHLLCNNAGVGTSGKLLWEHTLADWEWVVGVNLWSVVYGITTFVPIMLEQDADCHIVNTGSLAGLISGPGLGSYKVTKHSVVTLSETLYHELKEAEARIGVSVLCPAWVNTQIVDSERNRPAELQNKPGSDTLTPGAIEREADIRHVVEKGRPPAMIADTVFEAIQDETFYVGMGTGALRLVENRMQDILQQRNPTVL